MNAGTLADLLIHKGHASRRNVEVFWRGWVILINGVQAVSPWQILQFGDEVSVAGYFYRI